jgi:hypothetical protein
VFRVLRLVSHQKKLRRLNRFNPNVESHNLKFVSYQRIPRYLNSLCPINRKIIAQPLSPCPMAGASLVKGHVQVCMVPFPYFFWAIRRLTGWVGLFENFPHLAQATSNTPRGQACLVPTIARGTNIYACVFVLNTSDMGTEIDLTEAEVRVACQEAKLPGMTKVCHQTHNVCVVTFSNKHDANKARKKARLSFAVVPGPIPIIFGFSVKAESHLFEDNRVFVCDVKRNTVNHDTVLRHVREALQGPMADSFCFYIQEIRNKNQRLKRTRYILRVYDGVPSLSVERFYIPLDAADGKGHVRGIFKPWSKGWQCPACHEKCQAGGTSTCNSAELLHPQEHMK